MALPALVLGLAGVVSWRQGAGGAAAPSPNWRCSSPRRRRRSSSSGASCSGDCCSTAWGTWPAQLVVAALFVLTHSDALRGLGPLAYLAGANIFLASILFGLAYVRTASLAMPIGLHLAANVMQGPVLGFGVSGHEGASLLVPVLSDAPDWLSGGTFGLEASVPGLVCVVALLLILRGWRRYRAGCPTTFL